MSGTTTTESLWTPQTIIAVILLAIGAATVVGVFLKGDAAMINTIGGLVVGYCLGQVASFYFGSSKGSQAKDATIATVTATTGTKP